MTQSETPMRILKIKSCPTLSGKSTLTYHIGCNPQSAIHFRIHASTGGGTFSQEWIALKEIQQHLKKNTVGITSIVLYPLFRGKSVNTPSFLLAVMKHEGLVVPMKGKKRNHELTDPKPFLDQINKLIESDVDLDPKSKPRKAPIKKRTTPSKRRVTKRA